MAKMIQVTLTEELFKVLQRCVGFCLEDVQETGGYLEASRPELETRTGEADLLNLEAAIKSSTREVQGSW